jgi:hypothetical protein
MSLSKVRALVVVAAFVLTIVVLLGLPHEGFQWASAQVYETSPPQPPTYTGLPGIGFVLINEVASSGRTFGLGNAGTGVVGGNSFSLVSPYGGTAATVPTSAFTTGFQRYLQSGLVLPPSSQFITNPEGRRLFTQPYQGGEVRGYYLFTSGGTNVFQLNIYQNGVLANDQVMLFVAPNGGTVWVYRGS